MLPQNDSIFHQLRNYNNLEDLDLDKNDTDFVNLKNSLDQQNATRPLPDNLDAHIIEVFAYINPLH